MTFLPGNMQLTKPEDMPKEKTWRYKGHAVHVDSCGTPVGSPVTLVLLHGVGTNARQMSLLVGLPLARKYGFHSLALDCPGYGVTQVAPKSKVTYSDWVDLVDAFVDAQTRRQLNEGRGTRPIVLFGLSAGGMLAYQVAARNASVKGVIGMTFLDQRVQEVRDTTAHDLVGSRVGVPLAGVLRRTPLGGIRLPMPLTSKMRALVNDQKALRAFITDRSSAGNWVSMRFLADYMTYAPAKEPEDFETCPILLTQPEEDRWTPLRLSEIFLDRIRKVPVKRVTLEKAGHYPLEQPGIDQLHKAIAEFVENTVIGRD
ncbi:hypothetical protein NSK_000017 [Nannochloropsis salina CCMP1776]|uniref:AB hydrolase-1 domain-containing protein n=1 Tax=Nannochloropsis salina CCMP1776 TaxID=1027361 RepID=A0A4D9DE94_9STRA|nr:hypothetical protein NSK_000017 [Nannochloropsis salina CCMP1776]|eukprot:TFJ88443.1 hypothetical protein NSK_000017 [Nannochloropsis salina CCMP1776]